MPVVIKFKNIKIYVYPKDHLPKHVHVIAPSWEVKVEIDSQHILHIKGKITSRELKLVLSVVQEHKKRLEDAWYEYQKDN